MSKTLKYLYIAVFLCTSIIFSQKFSQDTPQPTYNIGFLIVATGKYIQFVEPLITSARKYFCTRHKVMFFVFTDRELQETPDIIKIYQEKLEWPYATMMRNAMYYNQKDLLQSMDYLFACDADMLFVHDIGDEILGDRVATMHPGFVGKRGSYETNPQSTACVRHNEGKYYFAGGFFGGKTNEFLTMTHATTDNIHNDLEKNIIAVWHDESHLNRYFIDHKPTVILSPSYCYPESWSLPYTKKLLALDKNHDQIRK